MGTNTSAFELLVLKRKIMGPCWLQIKKPHMDHKGVRTSVIAWLVYADRLLGAGLLVQS